MTPDERNLITGLFDRLGKTEAATGTKDNEALQLIQQQTTAVPTAPYLLVQTVLVQEHALTNAQARIADLERQVASARTGQPAGQPAPEEHGSFLGNLLKKANGGSTQPPPLPASAQARGPGQPVGAAQYGQQNPGGYYPGQQPPPMPYPTTSTMAPGGGGSFLKSALGTAAGVAGGAMLFQGIQNLMGHNAGPFAGGMSGLGGGHSAGGGQGFLGGAGGGSPEHSNASFGDMGGSVGDYADRFGGGGESSSGGGGGTVGDFADRFGGGESAGGGGGGTVGDYADAQGGGGGGFFDSAPEVQDTGFEDQGGGGGGTVGDYMDNSGGGGDDGGGFFDDSGSGSDDATV